MTEIRCKWCEATLPILADLDRALRDQVVDLVRHGSTAEAFGALARETGLTLKTAKAVTLHITRERGTCHRWPCKAKLETGRLDCPVCKGINFDW